MTSKFLNNNNGVDLSALQDGSFSIYAKSIKVNDLTPSTNVSTDPNKFLNSSSAGSGDTTYVGVVPATNCILKASTSDGTLISNSSITDDGFTVVTNATNGIKANKFSTPTGTDIQYLMANGSTLTASASAGNSNFYLYKNVNSSQTTPPPISYEVIFNNSSQSLATFVFISHITRDDINVEVFFKQVSQLNDLYIQDQNNSLNFIRYNITGTPIPSTTYISIPVVMTSFGGTGGDTFGNYVNIMVAFFTNLSDVDTRLSSADTRLSAIETKTQNQTSTSGQTNIAGALGVYSVASQAVLGSQYGLYMGSLYFNYATGYEFIPTADIVVSSFIVSTQAWQSSDSTKAMGIYRASDSALMGSATLTKTVLLSGYYGINCTPIKLSSGIKYVLSAQFVAFSDKYLEGAGVAVSFGAEISNVVGRSTLSALLIMPIATSGVSTTGPNNACFGNFIYSLGSSVSASKFIVPSGLSTEFLKADGTVDTTSYLPIGSSGTVSGYPFNPVWRATATITSSTKSYWFVVLHNQATLISGFSVYLDQGSDIFRMGIYRGKVSTGGSMTLCGQSAGGALPTIDIYARVPITAVVGQNLTFANGEYMTIAFHSQGSTNVFLTGQTTIGVWAELGYNSNSNYAAAGFPATLNSTSVLGGIPNRPCFELY